VSERKAYIAVVKPRRGDYAEMRDSTGRLDYLHGNPTGRRLTCQSCKGKGWAE